jgi:hypothetical protein
MKYTFKGLLLSMLLASSATPAQQSPDPALQRSIDELRNSVGRWHVVTEFLNDDGSTARTLTGSYEFAWVIEDRLISGRNTIPALQQSSATLFYIRESDAVIEMVSVGADGRLWVMTGPLGGDTRYTQVIETADGGSLQLRFTRYNVTADAFESRMERSLDGGLSWLPGNHQVFTRRDDTAAAAIPTADDKPGHL